MSRYYVLMSVTNYIAWTFFLFFFLSFFLIFFLSFFLSFFLHVLTERDFST